MRSNLLALGLVLLATSAVAQMPPRVRGVIQSVEGNALVVATPNEGAVRLTLTDMTGINGLERRTMADIKDNTFVGATAVKDRNGRWQATEVHIFPESMRGLGEGHRPWDRPGTTMTNATVDTAVTSVDGQVVTVKYKGGEKKIVLRPDTTFLTYVAAEKSELKPGARVAVTGVVRSGGAVEARRVVVGRDGVIPT